jgi:mannose-6-phosphate isomerase class I
MKSNYDKRPIVSIESKADLCLEGWLEIAETLQALVSDQKRYLVVIETYPGINVRSLAGKISGALGEASIFYSEQSFLSPAELRDAFRATLTDDPVFNFMRPWTINEYFDQIKLSEMRHKIAETDGLLVVLGAGAHRLAERPDLLISANVSRWEIQQRQRQHRIANLGFENAGTAPAELYKTAFFLDWRVADRSRHEIYRRIDFFLDVNNEEQPKMLPGKTLRRAVAATVMRPFRVVPFFDPGPWGGQWMRERFNLPVGPPNYAWGFDCVPEENSILLGFGDRVFELPAIVLVHEEPELLLGETVCDRFGAEFPIRFDFLDTVNGGNLSLQVHPGEAYISEHFGMPYTQDESYYMLHCEPDSVIYLGLKEEANREAMTRALEEANCGGDSFPADEFVAKWGTKKHDHFSIPAGTVHCSGEGNVVLEISATPYIFTFKLWDWGRTGLDGLPRPIHLKHGLANIRWDRNAVWVQRELLDQTVVLQHGDGWLEESTGLHRTQFLETRRHRFSKVVPHNTHGNLHVMNLVEGDEIIIQSPTGAFEPVVIHYAETFIVPASLGAYTISPTDRLSTEPMATLKAYVRP